MAMTIDNKLAQIALKRATVLRTLVGIVAFALIAAARGDGSTIGKIYKPYVQLLETELEYRALYERDSNDDRDDRQKHLLGLGRALSDRVAAEIYIIGVDEPGDDFEIKAYEGELKWQLTEQGEYAFDWGLLFELERETSDNAWEAGSTVIVVKEYARWISTANLALIYEWGGGIKNEWETAFAGELRYRNKQQFEPAIELYLSEGSKAIGPALNGMVRLAKAKKLAWSVGSIFGVDSDTADVSLKLNIEYEF